MLLKIHDILSIQVFHNKLMCLTSVRSETPIPFFVKKKNLSTVYLHIVYSYVHFTVKILNIYIYIYILYWNYSPGVWVGGRQEPPTNVGEHGSESDGLSPPHSHPPGPLLLTGHGWLFCQLWTLKKKYTRHKGLLSGLNEFIGINCCEVI